MVASVARKMKKPTNRKRKLKTKTNLKTGRNFDCFGTKLKLFMFMKDVTVERM